MTMPSKQPANRNMNIALVVTAIAGVITFVLWCLVDAQGFEDLMWLLVASLVVTSVGGVVMGILYLISNSRKQ